MKINKIVGAGSKPALNWAGLEPAPTVFFMGKIGTHPFFYLDTTTNK